MKIASATIALLAALIMLAMGLAEEYGGVKDTLFLGRSIVVVAGLLVYFAFQFIYLEANTRKDKVQ